MHERILTYINLVLLGLCGWFVWWLMNDNFYSEPAEVTRMTQILDGEETGYTPPGGSTETTQNPTPRPTPTPAPNRTPTRKPPYEQNVIIAELYTPTPTPTPQPTPTPAPPLLKDMVYGWRLVSLVNDTTVEFYDDRNKENFTMTVGGPAKIVPDLKGQQGAEYPVVLDSINMDELSIVLKFGIDQAGFAQQREVKSF